MGSDASLRNSNVNMQKETIDAAGAAEFHVGNHASALDTAWEKLLVFALITNTRGGVLEDVLGLEDTF